jgi:hypothetical protein
MGQHAGKTSTLAELQSALYIQTQAAADKINCCIFRGSNTWNPEAHLNKI